MKHLFLFHIHVGVRVAIRSFIPLFAAILFGIMFAPSPSAVVTALALRVFAPKPSTSGLSLIAVVAFLLPLLSGSKVSSGLNGWIRHLGFSQADQKRGLILALAMLQIPLWVSLFLLGVIAHPHAHTVAIALPRILLVLAAAVYAALPVHRRLPTVLCACFAAVCAFSTQSVVLGSGFLLLIVAHLVSGAVREIKRHKVWKSAQSLFDFKVAWRALGLRLSVQYIFSLIIIGMTAMFADNSELHGKLLAGTARFGGCMSVSFFISSVAAKLSARRPAWPWARSFPISSYRRTAKDALFLAVHAIPLLVPVALINFSAAFSILATLPLFSLRATSHICRLREHTADVPDSILHRLGVFLECFGIAALTGLLPWTVLLWLVGTVPAFISARNDDIRQKVSLWLELHYIAAGDSLNWSSR